MSAPACSLSPSEQPNSHNNSRRKPFSRRSYDHRPTFYPLSHRHWHSSSNKIKTICHQPLPRAEWPATSVPTTTTSPTAAVASTVPPCHRRPPPVSSSPTTCQASQTTPTPTTTHTTKRPRPTRIITLRRRRSPHRSGSASPTIRINSSRLNSILCKICKTNWRMINNNNIISRHRRRLWRRPPSSLLRCSSHSHSNSRRS